MNKNERIIKERYEKLGYRCLHNKGFCDFIFFKVVDNKPKDVLFCEVKSSNDRLRYEQQVFRNIMETLGLNYKIEIVHPNPHHSNPPQPTPIQSTPLHSTPIQSTPIQSRPRQSNPDQSKPIQARPIQANPNQKGDEL